MPINIEKAKTILKTTLRIVRTVLYIAWLLCLLSAIYFLILPIININNASQANTYDDFHPEVFIFILGWIVSILNIETALVLFRKYSKIFGVLHILLGIICFALTFISICCAYYL